MTNGTHKNECPAVTGQFAEQGTDLSNGIFAESKSVVTAMAKLARAGYATRTLASGFVICGKGLTIHCTDARLLALVAQGVTP